MLLADTHLYLRKTSAPSQPAIINHESTTPIELIFTHYGTSRSYSFILYDKPLQEKEKDDLNRLDSNIVLNDNVVLRCDNYYVWLEFPEDNLLHIQPELVNKYMATCFPDKQQFRPLPQ